MIIINTKINVDILKSDIVVFFNLEHFAWTNTFNDAYDFKTEMAADSFIKNVLNEKYPNLIINYIYTDAPIPSYLEDSSI